MHDELIKNLRLCSQCDFGQNCNECTQERTDKFCCDELLHQAAEAIEELQKDLERSKDYNAFWQHEAEETLKKFQVAISNKPRWIPVTERLPDVGKDVLCFCRANISLVLGRDGNLWREGADRYYMSGFVTHWMPLPEPPESEGEP